MKRLCFIALVLSATLVPVAAEGAMDEGTMGETRVPDDDGSVYIGAGTEFMIYRGLSIAADLLYVQDKEYQIRYDTETDLFYYVARDTGQTCRVPLDRDSLQIIRNACGKYLEWEKTAVENEVKLEKEIPDSTVRCPGAVTWMVGSEPRISAGLELYFKFNSVDETDHRLLFYSNKVYASYGDYLGIQTRIFSKAQVEALLAGISEEHIREQMGKIEKEKGKGALFR